jgi:hypothetical protein
MNFIQKLYRCAALISLSCTTLWASPPGEMLLIVASTKQDKPLELHMIEPDWYVAPGNTHTQKTLEQAMLKRCLKRFNAKKKEDLDQNVRYKSHICNKDGHRYIVFPMKLAAPSKIFLEAFHEFSILWHHTKPSKGWVLRTDKEGKRYSVCSDGKTFLKPSRYKDYLLSCDVSQEDSYNVCLTIFRKKDKERMLSLMGTQYSPKALEKLSKDKYKQDKRFQI